MKFIIVGFGIQGRKRKKLLGKECVAVVDKYYLKEYIRIQKNQKD